MGSSEGFEQTLTGARSMHRLLARFLMLSGLLLVSPAPSVAQDTLEAGVAEPPSVPDTPPVAGDSLDIDAAPLPSLRGHTGPVRAVAFSPDGSILASLGKDGTIKLWSTSDWTLLHTLEEEICYPVCFTFTPDGEFLASVGRRKSGDILLWRVSDGTMERILPGRLNKWIWSVAYSPDGSIIAAGAEQSISIWQASDSAYARELIGHRGPVHGVAFSPDGTALASGSYDYTVRFWSVSNGELVGILSEHGDIVTDVAFSPNDLVVASASADSSVKLWRPMDQAPVLTLENHSGRVNSVAFSPDGSIVASAGEDGNVRLWQTSNGRLLHDLTGDSGPIAGIAISPDGTILASAGRESAIGLWGLEGVPGPSAIQRTRPIFSPQVVLSVSFREASGEKLLNPEEEGSLLLSVANRGKGPAHDVRISVESQVSVQGLSLGEPDTIDVLNPGETEQLTIALQAGSDMIDSEARVKIQAFEANGFDSDSLIFSFKTSAAAPVQVAAAAKETAPEDRASGRKGNEEISATDQSHSSIDVDVNILETDIDNPTGVAVVIGNQKYTNRDLPEVEYANRDAEVVREYLTKTFGYHEENIIYKADATLSDFETIFGTTENRQGSLYDLVKSMRSNPDTLHDIFIFYSGHGVPNDEDRSRYLAPVDCGPLQISNSMYPLKRLVSSLSRIPIRSVTIVIDAAFSGKSEKGEILPLRGPAPQPLDPLTFTLPNGVMFVSAGDDEIASRYADKQHGLFTYLFLKAVGGEADPNRDDQVTAQEILGFMNDFSTGIPSHMDKIDFTRKQTPQMHTTNPQQVIVRFEEEW